MSDESRLGEEGLSSGAASDIRTVAKGGAVQIAGQMSQRGFSFIFTAVALRILGAAGYGIYRQVAQILTVAGQLGLAGFNYATMRFITQARGQGRHDIVRGTARVGLIGATIGSAVVVIGIVVFARPLASMFADSPADEAHMTDLLRLGAAYVPLFAWMQLLRYCTQAYKTMVPSVMSGNVVQPVGRFLFGVTFLLVGFEVAGAISSLVISNALGAAVAAYYFARLMTQEERSSRTKAEAGPLVRFALPQAGASLFSVQDLGLGIILLGIFAGDRSVGFFALGLTLQGPGNIFLGGIVNIWAPVVTDLHARGEIARLRSLYQTLNRWIATFSFPVFAALIIESRLWARLVGGPELAPAAAVIAILAVGNFFYTGTGPTGYLISMTGRPGINFVNSVIGVALYAGLAALIVPDHGAVGMAVVDSIVTAVMNVNRVIVAWVILRIQPFGRSFLKPVAATIAGAGALLLWKLIPGEGNALSLAGVAVAALVYAAVLKVMGLDPEEQHVWDRIRSRAFKRSKPGTGEPGTGEPSDGTPGDERGNGGARGERS